MLCDEDETGSGRDCEAALSLPCTLFNFLFFAANPSSESELISSTLPS
jgi:hypothetical protein